MSDYLAKQILGETAFHGITRILFCHQKAPDGTPMLRGGFNTIVLTGDSGLPESGQWQLLDCEIYIKPVRVERFRGMKGLRIDQALGDYHFGKPFGQCVSEENDCCSCAERNYPPYSKKKKD